MGAGVTGGRGVWTATLCGLVLGVTACGTNVVSGGSKNPEARLGSILVSDVHVVHPPSGSYAAGGSATVDFLVQNSGSDREKLIAGSSPVAARVDLLSDARSVNYVLVVSDSTVTRGTQLRLLDLKQRLKKGDRVSVTFRFQNSGELTLKAPVR